MKISESAKYVLGVSAAVALLAGCSSGGSQLAPSGSPMGASGVHQTMGGNHKVSAKLALVVPTKVQARMKIRHFKGVKQIKPNCCALQKTAVITDAFGGPYYEGGVYMFDYVSGAMLGSVPQPPEGFVEPQGVCTDNNGNFYIANTSESTVDEYTHSGSFVTAISDSGQYPVGCAYDKTSGTLAIFNIIDVYGGAGSVSTATGGTITNTYYPSNMSRVYFGDYEGKTGTLWIDGSDYYGDFQYDSFSGGSFTPVTVTGATIGFPGGVKWSGKTKSMNVGDQDTFYGPTFYQVSDTGAVTGSTVTACPSGFCDIVQNTIKGPGLVGPDAGSLTANRFAYPAGGNSVLNYSATWEQPIGAGVSPDKGN